MQNAYIMKSSTLVLLVVCFGLTVLIVCEGVPLDHVVYSKSLSSQDRHSSWDFDNEQQRPRTIRQTNLYPSLPQLNTTKHLLAPNHSQRNNLPSGEKPKGTRKRTQLSTNPTPVQSSTVSNELRDEIQRDTCNTFCRERTTYQFNPVCANNSLTYQNRQFLDCVIGCGIKTEFSYIGSCVRRR